MDAAIRLHIVDSFAAMPEVLESPAGRALDMGSGGGFPGVPLAVACTARSCLLDSVAKKGAAVEQPFFVDSSAWGRRLKWSPLGRRSTRRRSPEAFAVVVARAVAPLPSLVELASPCFGWGGG